jgi:serine/threonine protein kinase/tetratricopeptide (TPR) repeat protein
VNAAVRNADTVFAEAIEIASPEERAAFIERAYASDAELRRQVEKLVRDHFQAGSFLERPAANLDKTGVFTPSDQDDQLATTTTAAAHTPGTMIGPYKLLEQIGEGGMGLVFVAEQQQPIKRRVALKIIKPGMDSRQVIARFEAERQALAMMDHPNIAKVHDGGTTPEGRPYFVMEFVKGTPITDYCDQHRLTTRPRLELFVDVCQAVQHAHQKGIIHRDLKPSNVLVEIHDVRPVVKVIDFGIAKATGQQLTDKTLYTGVAQMVGTPLYMSPEQAGLSSLDVDTRSDVYSLGVLLYELLTGTTPFDGETLKKAGYDEMRRIIREDEPPRPSARLSTLQRAHLSTVAERRGLEPRRLSQHLRGELDWIVMRALEKDRNRRYESASGLARDVERYLNEEPVEAAPPSAGYRLKKLLRRNKGRVLVAGLVLIGLLVTTPLSLMLAARDRELAHRRQLVQQGIDDALAEVMRLRGEAATANLSDQAALARAREQLQRAAALTESGPIDSHLVEQVQQLAAEFDQVQRDRQLLVSLDTAWLAKANTHIGQFRFHHETMIPVLDKAFKAYGLEVGKRPAQEAAAEIGSRPEMVREQLLVALDEWRALVRKPGIGVRLRKTAGGTFIDTVIADSPARRDGRLKPGDELVGIGKDRAARVEETRNLSLPEITQLVRGDSGTIVRLEVIPKGETNTRVYEIERDPTAAWLKAVADAADADSWRRRLRDAFEIPNKKDEQAALEKLANEAAIGQQPVGLLTMLGDRLAELKARDVAIKFLRKVRQKHPADVWVNTTLAGMLKNARPPQFEEAIRYYTAAIALRPESSGLHLNLGAALNDSGKVEEALDEYREALRIDPMYTAPRCNLVESLTKLGKPEEAEAVARAGVRLNPDDAAFHANPGNALKQLGKEEEAIREYREAARLDPEIDGVQNQLAIDLFGKGKHDESLAKFHEIIRMNPKSVETHYNLALALQMLKKVDDSVAQYRETLRLKPDHMAALINLSNLLTEQGKPADVVAAYHEALRHNPEAFDNRFYFASFLTRQGRLNEAIAELREAIRLYPRCDLAHNSLAWLLATAADTKLRQPAQAVEHARIATGLLPKAADCWNTLGVACYRAGQWTEAITALEKSVQLGSHGTPNWFFLAMAHWQLGHKDKAVAYFEKAVAGMDQQQTQKEELRRFRAEAAELLGIQAAEPELVPPPRRVP